MWTRVLGVVVAFGLAWFCVVPLVIAADPLEKTPEEVRADLIPLTGIWVGTLHIEGAPATEYVRHVELKIYEDGSFDCRTHDLVGWTGRGPSTGTIMQAENMLTFWAPGKIGTEGHLFRYTVVLREARSSDGPPRLYLHDHGLGVAIHLSLFDSLGDAKSAQGQASGSASP